MTVNLEHYPDFKATRISDQSSGVLAANGAFTFTYALPPDKIAYLYAILLTRTAGIGTFKVLQEDLSVDDEIQSLGASASYNNAGASLALGTHFGGSATLGPTIIIPLRRNVSMKVAEDGGVNTITIRCQMYAYVRKLAALKQQAIYTRRR